MKYYSTFNVFKNTWDQTACAFWQKYPNPYSKHVLTEDLISRTVAGSKLFSTRLLTKTNHMPKWGNAFFGNNARHVCIVEESVLDPEQKTMTTYTHNIGYQKFMVVIEKCTYTPSTDNKEWTECQKEAWIDSSFNGFSRVLRKLGYERFKANAPKSFRGLQHVMDKMFVPETVPETLPETLPEMLAKQAKLPTTTLQSVDKLTGAAKARAQDMAAMAKSQGMAAKAKSQDMAAKAKSQTAVQ